MQISGMNSCYYGLVDGSWKVDGSVTQITEQMGALKLAEEACFIGPYDLLKQAGICPGLYAAITLYGRANEMESDVAMDILDECIKDRLSLPKNPNKLIELFQKGRDLKNPIATWCLGFCYEKGFGVQKNLDEAVRLYGDAAFRGDVEALFSTCFCCANGIREDASQTVELYKAAAEKGLGRAARQLYFCYKNGIGVSKSEEQAAFWFQKATTLCEAEAKFYLGLCCEYGLGVDEDIDKAVECYKAAALLGNPKAMYCLGICYNRGRGLPRDRAEAIKWFQQAANLDNARACSVLGYHHRHRFVLTLSKEVRAKKEHVHLYKKGISLGASFSDFALCILRGDGVEKDPEEAASLFQKAADLGNEQGMYYLRMLDPKRALTFLQNAAHHRHGLFDLAECYEQGKLAQKNLFEAQRLYQQASDKGHLEATERLGDRYFDGRWGPEDHQRGCELWRKAADKGSSSALCKLADCYVAGDPVRKDPRQAWRLYLRAVHLEYFEMRPWGMVELLGDPCSKRT